MPTLSNSAPSMTSSTPGPIAAEWSALPMRVPPSESTQSRGKLPLHLLHSRNNYPKSALESFGHLTRAPSHHGLSITGFDAAAIAEGGTSLVTGVLHLSPMSSSRASCTAVTGPPTDFKLRSA